MSDSRTKRAFPSAFLIALFVMGNGISCTSMYAESVSPAFSNVEQTAQSQATGRYDEENYDPTGKGDLRLAGWNIQRCCGGNRTARPADYHGGHRHNRPFDRHARVSRTHFRYRKPRRSSGFRLNHPTNASNVTPRHPRRTASPKHAR